MSSPLLKTLAEIRSGKGTLTKRHLAHLSNLPSQEVGLFSQAWPDMDTSLRRKTISRLVQASAEDIALNFDAVFQACLGDTDAEVRVKALNGLEECDDCRLIGRLSTLLRQDEEVAVRASAARALARFALLAELGKINRCYVDELASVLLGAFSDADEPETVRAQALESVAPISLPQVAEAIRIAYESPQLRASAVTAMGLNCNPAWLSIIVCELDSQAVELRERAARACGEVGEEGTVSRLVQLLEDTERQVSHAAIDALGKIGGPQARKALRRIRQNSDPETSKLAEAALEEIATEDDMLSFRISG